MPTMPHWPEHLELRPEVVTSDGSVGDLQMSLGKVVFQTEDVPYRNLDYWCEITEPTDSLLGVFAKVARRLWSDVDAEALFQFDQGMGGGKSHAMVGLWHMARQPQAFLATDIGQQVADLAQAGGRTLDINDVHTVALCADRFSPGKPSELYGPAENLFERFLWALFPDDRAAYDRYVAQGSNKQTISDALRSVGRPVLILLDELMDYIQRASSASYVDRLPDENSFLNDLFDACDDIPNVAFMLVMIRSEFDEAGYNDAARSTRDYVQSRIERNGTSVRVTESKDFINIIRKRIFTDLADPTVPQEAADAFAELDGTLWQEKGFDQLTGGRSFATTRQAVEDTYPFHPDLVSLVQNEWSSTVGFQRVRSTVRIFSATVLHWVQEHQAGRWSPHLIGVGDLPLDGRGVLDNILNSGLLLNRETDIRGFANLASTDIISLSGDSGRAVAIDDRLQASGVDVAQPRPAVRMATALFNLSLVNRTQGALGATRPELLVAVWEPGAEYTNAEDVFTALVDPEDGLGSLESTDAGNNRNRYWLSTKKTLTAIHRAARAQVSDEQVGDRLWQATKKIAGRHVEPFERLVPVDRLDGNRTFRNVVEDVVARATRLVVLDPRQWTLANGNHETTKADIERLLGLGDEAVQYFASAVVAVANSHSYRFMTQQARDVVAWRQVIRNLSEAEPDIQAEAQSRLSEAERSLNERIEKGFRHYVYTSAGERQHTVEFHRFEDDTKTSIRGDHVWTALVENGRAINRGRLDPTVLEMYLDASDRALTPKEVVSSFYDRPSQILVSDISDITAAWDQLVLRGDWQLVDADGPLNVRPGQIGPERMDARFERVTATPEDETEPDEPSGSDDTPAEPETGTTLAPDRTHKVYKVSLKSTSLGNRDTHRNVWRLVSKLAEQLDPTASAVPGPDQVLSFSISWERLEGDDIDALREAIEALNGTFEEEEPLL